MGLGGGFGAGFLQGVQAARQGLDVYKQAKLEKELEEASKLEQEQIDGGRIGGTDEQFQAALTADPNAGIGEARKIATQGNAPPKFKVGDQTQDKAFSPDQVQTARQLAMAGVFERNGQAEKGISLRNSVKQGARDDQRFGRETKQWEKQDKADAQEVEYQEGRKALMSQTPMAQNEAQYAKEVEAYQANLAKYKAAASAPGMEQRDIAELGLPPQPPKKQPVTPGQMLSTYAALVDHDAKYGKLTTEGFMNFGKQLQAVRDEGYVKALNMARSGGSLEEVAAAFNASGAQKFDPKAVVSDKVGKGPDGVPTRIIQFKDAEGNVQTLNTTAELDALGKADQVYQRFYQAQGDKRAAAHLGLAQSAEKRAQTLFEDGETSREAIKEEAGLRVELAKLDDTTPEGKARSEAIQAKLLALKTGTRGTGAGHDPADILKAKALVAQGIYANQGEALDALVSKPDKMFQEFQKAAVKESLGNAEKANEIAGKMMESNGWERTKGGTWKRTGGGGEGPPPEAVAMLKGDPKLAADFDAKYGKGAAARVLGK